MKRMSMVITALSVLAAGGCQNAEPPPAQEMPAEQPQAEQAPAAAPASTTPSMPEPQSTIEHSLMTEAQWVTLFAGHDLDSFTMVGDANWSIVDDYVEATAGMGGFLVTRGAYGDVLLRAEFWTSPDANSGIFMRCQDAGNIAAATCYEVNIYDQRPDQTYRTGGIVDVAAPMAQIDAGNQWNTFEIRMEGPRLVVTLNGTLVVDVEDEQFTHGPIAFQWGAGTVRFRNILLRPL